MKIDVFCVECGFKMLDAHFPLQLDEDVVSSLLSWVPRKLAGNVRCILSMINDTSQHVTLMSRESKPQELHMTPLDFESRRVSYV